MTVAGMELPEAASRDRPQPAKSSLRLGMCFRPKADNVEERLMIISTLRQI